MGSKRSRKASTFLLQTDYYYPSNKKKRSIKKKKKKHHGQTSTTTTTAQTKKRQWTMDEQLRASFQRSLVKQRIMNSSAQVYVRLVDRLLANLMMGSGDAVLSSSSQVLTLLNGRSRKATSDAITLGPNGTGPAYQYFLQFIENQEGEGVLQQDEQEEGDEEEGEDAGDRFLFEVADEEEEDEGEMEERKPLGATTRAARKRRRRLMQDPPVKTRRGGGRRRSNADAGEDSGGKGEGEPSYCLSPQESRAMVDAVVRSFKLWLLAYPRCAGRREATSQSHHITYVLEQAAALPATPRGPSTRAGSGSIPVVDDMEDSSSSWSSPSFGADTMMGGQEENQDKAATAISQGEEGKRKEGVDDAALVSLLRLAETRLSSQSLPVRRSYAFFQRYLQDTKQRQSDSGQDNDNDNKEEDLNSSSSSTPSPSWDGDDSNY